MLVAQLEDVNSAAAAAASPSHRKEMSKWNILGKLQQSRSHESSDTRSAAQRGLFGGTLRGALAAEHTRSLFINTGRKHSVAEYHTVLNLPTAPRVRYGCELRQDLVPSVVRDITAVIEQRGVVDGIYRLSGSQAEIHEMKTLYNTGATVDLLAYDVHSVASLLKQYFRELAEPMIPFDDYERLISLTADPSACSPAHLRATLRRVHDTLIRLKRENYHTLKHLVLHLHHMNTLSRRTSMDAHNLGIVWAPNMQPMSLDSLLRGGDPKGDASRRSRCIAFIITHAVQLFMDRMPSEVLHSVNQMGLEDKQKNFEVLNTSRGERKSYQDFPMIYIPTEDAVSRQMSTDALSAGYSEPSSQNIFSKLINKTRKVSSRRKESRRERVSSTASSRSSSPAEGHYAPLAKDRKPSGAYLLNNGNTDHYASVSGLSGHSEEFGSDDSIVAIGLDPIDKSQTSILDPNDDGADHVYSAPQKFTQRQNSKPDSLFHKARALVVNTFDDEDPIVASNLSSPNQNYPYIDSPTGNMESSSMRFSTPRCDMVNAKSKDSSIDLIDKDFPSPALPPRQMRQNPFQESTVNDYSFHRKTRSDFQPHHKLPQRPNYVTLDNPGSQKYAERTYFSSTSTPCASGRKDPVLTRQDFSTSFDSGVENNASTDGLDS